MVFKEKVVADDEKKTVTLIDLEGVYDDKTAEGKAGVFKEKVEIDEENKIIKLIGLEGDVFKLYKVYNGIWHLTPKGQGSLAKLTLEYEKLNESVPAPHIYLDFMISLTTDIDAGLVQA
ncbi:hypothetical protein GH714_042143 [Hevea brasiliensis]|uniref:Bet v I/Major latex protein domain-containing protein n=1 Tax=Hevea brasiliensis TaxID=3981 RepID=A0A6A6MSD0_HEVBR|nr:hypothetical protein GH714_042143 [Hevea brasiliensis]